MSQIYKSNGKYASIYVRTSSEHQGEKSSPDEQEADCRKLAAENGLTVVAVYRDVERYRAKNRLVDPSGTRSDRPGLVNMLRDAAAGKFDTILAWREDRLYRGMRSMLFVLDNIQEHGLNVILARESFDPKMAPIKAWVAGMELEGMKERMSMGVKARLRAGKANTGQDRYGYQRNGEVIKIVEEEAKCVRQIFEWYIQRVPMMEIRRRLIEADAPQKGSSVPRKIRWARSSIQSILRAAKEYAYGIKIQRRDGEAFEIPIEPIIDISTYQAFLKVREANIKYPSHNIKRDYLIGGMMICPCGYKWGGRTNSYTRRNRKGEKVKRKSLYGTYYCKQRHKELINPDCPRTIGSMKADEYVWEKVCDVISKPEILIAEARRHVEELRERADTALADSDRLQKELDSLALERQWVITQARKGKITEEDMDYQLGSITLQELNLKQELVAYDEIHNLSLLNKWEEKAAEYFLDLQIGLESLNAAPQTKEERREVFEIKRKTVQTLVDKILIGKERKLNIVFRLNILSLLNQSEEFSEVQQVETYTHKPACRARRHLCAGGG